MFYTDEATIVKPGEKTLRGGEKTQDWGSAAERKDTGKHLSIDPLTPEEIVATDGDVDIERLAVSTRPQIILNMLPGDRVEYRGNTYRLVGAVRLFRHPITGDPDHQEFTLEQISVGTGHG